MSEAEALQRKKKVRAGHRASVTRTQGRVAATLGASPPDLDKLSMLKLTLEEKLKTLKELDAKIIELVSEDVLETEIQQADECQEIFEALVKVNRTLTLATVTSIATPHTVTAPTD